MVGKSEGLLRVGMRQPRDAPFLREPPEVRKGDQAMR